MCSRFYPEPAKLSALRRRAGVRLVEQFAKTALEVADHAYVMEGGKIAIDGPPEELRKNERVLAAYLG